MKTRIKKPVQTLTREQAEGVMTQLAHFANQQRELIADRDARVLLINQAFEAQLSSLTGSINDCTALLQNWAETNPAEFPSGRKSIALTNGTLGFRTGTPKLALLNKSWYWKRVLDLLKSTGLTHYIRTKEEVDKEAFLAAAAAGQPISQFGLKVTQDESFFIEPNLTKTDARQTTDRGCPQPQRV